MLTTFDVPEVTGATVEAVIVVTVAVTVVLVRVAVLALQSVVTVAKNNVTRGRRSMTTSNGFCEDDREQARQLSHHCLLADRKSVV